MVEGVCAPHQCLRVNKKNVVFGGSSDVTDIRIASVVDVVGQNVNRLASAIFQPDFRPQLCLLQVEIFFVVHPCSEQLVLHTSRKHNIHITSAWQL